MSGRSGAGRDRTSKGKPARDALTHEQYDAILRTHSGLAQISIPELAILLRCRADRPVEGEEVVASLLTWFDRPISVEEVIGWLDRLMTLGWLEQIGQRQIYHTTALGREVVEQMRRPIMKAGIWTLTGGNILQEREASDEDE
ncbi:hypothetical protein [Sphingobium sp. B11D3A]|uniref:hypothetical protein n=1 Tax=Sphingobium sp. B11D3A TaxID=2940574 RepID=UPI002225AC32|nr:hypothetical protein [Sphingobium sp. B11D3A]MCW2393562.1 DNA-binding PadR family transcriptional regulator [Sphingobium sp. B11D3A]